LARVGLFCGLLKSPCPPPTALLSRFYAVLFMDSQAIFKWNLVLELNQWWKKKFEKTF
jgi:hypothetical protein